MRILFVRHGDPDYLHDSLTQTGKREAEALAPRLAGENIKDFYVSPLGRARETAEPVLKLLDAQAQVMDWMQEFSAKLYVSGDPFLQKAYPDTEKVYGKGTAGRIVWDMMPASWRNDPVYYSTDGWKETPVAGHSDMIEKYDWVCSGLDALLASYGYRREGGLYVTQQGNNDTIALICHFGVTCVMLAHLWGISPFVLLHCLCNAPTSVTSVRTEEREKGKVIFRANMIGDVSHLYAAGMQPSASARFCEVYENDWERH